MASGEVNQQITMFEEEIERHTTALESEDDPIERARILEAIKVKQEQILEITKSIENASQDVRRSTRIHKLTDRMAEFQESERQRKDKHLKKIFAQKYESWKELCKSSRQKLKGYCTDYTLSTISLALTDIQEKLIEAYENIRQAGPPDQEIRRQIDTCSSINSQLLQIVASKQRDSDTANCNTKLKEVLQQDDNESIFSTVASRRSPSYISESSSSRRAKAAADLAVQEVQFKMLKAKEAKQAELDELQRQQDQKRRELEHLENENKLETARAIFNIYDQECKKDLEDGPTNLVGEFNHSVEDSKVTVQQSSPEPIEVSSLARALQQSIGLSRLPAPEPSVFTGDPITYIEWKTSFKVLIETKAISAAERMYYLKRYLGGAALKAVEGFFYNNSEESYTGAWVLLEERYGHSFKVQMAFRDKLSKWQKIGPKDATALQQFADFLKACLDALPHVPGLKILDDCQENQRLLSKLPDWATSRWNRQVTRALDEKGIYPGFKAFVEYVTGEARIACNPISSLQALKAKDPSEAIKEKRDSESRRIHRNKGTTLVTELKEVDKNKHSYKEKQASDSTVYKPKPCLFCQKISHQIWACPAFGSKTLVERKDFIRENRLCYGCLKKGHQSKDCQRRSTCDKCKRRHPTIIHEEFPVSNSSTVTKESPSKKERIEVSAAVSCGVQLEDGNSTSMMVPVWVSSTESPSNEILTYAMLDTQSDSTFILDDVASAISVHSEPVRLRLSTMTSSSSILECQAVSNLSVRGMFSPDRIQFPRSYTREFIPGDKSRIPTRKTAEKWPHLREIAHQMPPLQGCDVGLLIGYNCPQALAPRETITGRNDEPYAIRTDLGWTVIGYEEVKAHSYATSVCHRVSVREAPYVSPMSVLSVLEADFSEKSHGEKVVSQEDLKFLNCMETGIHQTENGHYSMPLPFKDGRPNLPFNKRTALVRLNHLKKKFVQNPKYFSDYKKFMSDVIEKGEVEKVEREAEEGRFGTSRIMACIIPRNLTR